MATVLTIEGLLKKEEYLTIKEICLIARISRTTIYAMIENGQMPPPKKVGVKSIRWPTAEIREWLKNLPTATLGTLGKSALIQNQNRRQKPNGNSN